MRIAKLWPRRDRALADAADGLQSFGEGDIIKLQLDTRSDTMDGEGKTLATTKACYHSPLTSHNSPLTSHHSPLTSHLHTTTYYLYLLWLYLLWVYLLWLYLLLTAYYRRCWPSTIMACYSPGA